MPKLKHIKKTVDGGYTSWSVPELRDACVRKRYESWELTVKRVDLLWACKATGALGLGPPRARTLQQMDEYVDRMLSMSDHELVERAYLAKTTALEMSGNDRMMDNQRHRMVELWSDRADLLMLLYRDRVGQPVDGQVSLAAE